MKTIFFYQGTLAIFSFVMAGLQNASAVRRKLDAMNTFIFIMARWPFFFNFYWSFSFIMARWPFFPIFIGRFLLLWHLYKMHQ